MANDRKKGLAGMDNKQKFLLVVIVIIFLVIIYLVSGMFSSGGTEPAPTVPAPKAMSATTPNATPASTTPSVPGTAAMPGSSEASPVVSQPQGMRNSSLPETQFLAAQREAQDTYLKALNQLQMLRIQKEISETDQAIALAKLAKVKAETDMTNLLTKPNEPTPIPMPAAYANQLGVPGGLPVAAPGGTVSTAPAGATPPQIMAQSTSAETQYVVISISMQMNRWAAVLGAQGKIFTVSIGDVLPLDGSTVVSINNAGVVLRTKAGVRKKISLIGSI